MRFGFWDWATWIYTVIVPVMTFAIEYTYDIPKNGHVDYMFVSWMACNIAYVQWKWWRNA